MELVSDKSVTTAFHGSSLLGLLLTKPITSWPAASNIFAIFPPTKPLEPVTAILAIVEDPSASFVLRSPVRIGPLQNNSLKSSFLQ